MWKTYWAQNLSEINKFPEKWKEVIQKEEEEEEEEEEEQQQQQQQPSINQFF